MYLYINLKLNKNEPKIFEKKNPENFTDKNQLNFMIENVYFVFCCDKNEHSVCIQ